MSEFEDIWFSADYHLGHKNIIKHDNRPYSDVEEMDTAIIANHNSVVKPSDKFYFAGDLTWAKRRADIENYLSQLQGQLFFIKGNHDYKETIRAYEKYGVYLGEKKRIQIDGLDIILDHFANRVWNKSHHGSLHFYGHSHGSLEAEPWGKSIDIGITNAARILGEWRPFNYHTELKPIMDQRTIKFVDHHTERL